MILSGNNFLSISRQTGLSFDISLNPTDSTEKEFGFSGVGSNFSIKLINNKIFNPDQKVVSTINLNEIIRISGDIFKNKYNLYLNKKVVSFNKPYNFSYFDHFYFKSITNTDILGLNIKGSKPSIVINIPNNFNVGNNIDCSINVNNLSARIYSGQINDLSSGSKSSFVLSNLPSNGSGNFQIKTTGAIQDVDFKDYPIELNLYTNFGTIKNYYNITGKYQEYQPFVELKNIIDADNFPIGESGKSVYRLEYEISSGENIIPPDISLSFAYQSGYTGLEQASVPGTGIYNINYTGNIIGSGNVISPTNTSYNLTGFNILTNTNVSGNVNLNLSKFIYLNGNLTNNVTVNGTGLKNTSVQNDEDFQATGTNLVALNASGNVFVSGALTGSVNNQPAIGISYVLSNSGGIFTDLNLIPLSFSSYSGIMNTGYLLANDYFTGNVGAYPLGNLNATGIATGKNETLFIYSGNNLSGLFTGNLYGSGNIHVQENYSTNQRVTGYLSGDIAQRQISLDIPTINLSRFGYFTGNYNTNLNIPIIGTASGKDQNNLEIITNVTGSYGLSSGLTFSTNDSGIKYIVLNNFLSKNPIELASYLEKSLNLSGNTSSPSYIRCIKNTLYIGYDTLNIFKLFTGNNENWNEIYSFSGTGSFGCSAGINKNENKLLIGAATSGAGVVHIYENNNGVWSNANIIPYNTTTGYRFGRSLDINDSGNIFIVGVPNYRTTLYNSGLAVIYTGSGLNYAIDTTLYGTPSQTMHSYFGTSVAINSSGNKVAVSSLSDSSVGFGAIYIYEKNTNWDLVKKITGLYQGGYSVSFSKNDDIIIFDSGAPSANQAKNGVLSIVKNSTGSWDPVANITGDYLFARNSAISSGDKILSTSVTYSSPGDPTISGSCSIFGITGNLENKIYNFNFSNKPNTIATSNNDLNIYIITGNTNITYFSGDFSHLGLKSNNLAYQNIINWKPINTFVNIPQTLSIIGSGDVSLNHTGNYTGLQINNKTLLTKCQQGGSNASIISEINNKLFTGVWSGTGIISSTNENVTFNSMDSGVKILVGTKTGIPASFNLINSLGNSYQNEVFRSGNFSGYFSGNVFGSGMVYRSISGYPTGIIKSGNLISGLYFNTGTFNQNISGNVLNGVMIYDNIVTGLNNGDPLTGRISSIIATGNYSSGFLEQVTGTILNGISYLKTFNQSFPYVKTGLDFINRTDLALISNVYTGNLLSAPQQTIYIEVARAPSYNYVNTMSGKLNIKLSTIHGDITTGAFIDL